VGDSSEPGEKPGMAMGVPESACASSRDRAFGMGNATSCENLAKAARGGGGVGRGLGSRGRRAVRNSQPPGVLQCGWNVKGND